MSFIRRIDAVQAIVVMVSIAAGTGVSVNAQAQEKCQLSGKYSAAESRFVQQHIIDVRDLPGHQVRVVEIQRTPIDAKPNCEGVKVTELVNTGYSDYVNTNGRAWGYRVTTLTSGEKIYAQYTGTSHTVTGSDGAKRSTYYGTYVITGGTGRYARVRGQGREVSTFDIAKGYNEITWDEEYWFE